jgi:uncharacterized protein (DUF983 family)
MSDMYTCPMCGSDQIYDKDAWRAILNKCEDCGEEWRDYPEDYAPAEAEAEVEAEAEAEAE